MGEMPHVLLVTNRTKKSILKTACELFFWVCFFLCCLQYILKYV